MNKVHIQRVDGMYSVRQGFLTIKVAQGKQAFKLAHTLTASRALATTFIGSRERVPIARA